MIEVKIIGTTPLKALASATAFGMHRMKDQEVHAVATHTLEMGESKASKSDTVLTTLMAPAAPATSAPVNPTPASVALVNPVPAPVAAVPVASLQATPPSNASAVVLIAATPTHTMKQIDKTGADLMFQDAAKMPELLVPPQKYGAQVITQPKPEQLSAFATELRGLGAKLQMDKFILKLPYPDDYSNKQLVIRLRPIYYQTFSILKARAGLPLGNIMEQCIDYASEHTKEESSDAT